MSDILNRIAALPPDKRSQLIRQLREQRTTADLYDVTILGGGLAGLTLALQIKKTRPTTNILVVEKQKHPVPEAAHKVGESTVEIAAHYLRDILGLEEHLQTQQLRKFGLRMFFSSNGNQDLAQRVELGPSVRPLLATYQLDRGRLENMLGNQLPLHGIPFLDTCKVQQISLQPGSNFHRLQVLHKNCERQIQTRWVVDASGRNTLLQRKIGLDRKVGHNANAVWFRVGYSIDINEWSTDRVWKDRISEGDRSLSTNHLMGPGYWVWLIRLASGSTSVGIVADASIHPFEKMNLFERALAWLHTYEPQCATVIEQHRDKIQDFRVMKNYSYSCLQVFSGERWCLTGEAGVALDPLYSPGSDLIAISNGLICDLITRHLNGEDIKGRVLVHNKLFLSLANTWLGVYEQQYPLMDNAQIMVAKVIWDTAFYWGVFGLLYFHDAFRNIADSPSIAANLSRIISLSNRVQAFFREWHAVDQAPTSGGMFIDLYSSLDFMGKLHIGMAAGLSHAELEVQFAANVRLFERIAGQMVGIVIDSYADHPEHEARLHQIQRWQTEQFLADLIALYRRESKANPIDSSWITLGQNRPVVQGTLTPTPVWDKQKVSK